MDTIKSSDYLIKTNLNILDNFFQNFDTYIRTIANEKENHYDKILIDEIDHKINLIENFIIENLNLRRTNLMNLLNKSLQSNLNNILIKKNSQLIQFIENNIKLNDTSLLIGNLNYENKFQILKKFDYFNYLNQYTFEIELNEDFILFFSVRILILSPNRLFVYLKTRDNQTYFKIFNNKCEECFSEKIDHNLVYKNVISYGSKIVSLFYDPKTKNKIHCLNVYDNRLQLKASKLLNIDLALCALTDNEIICWNTEDKYCMIFDYDLDLKQTLGQNEISNEPFYFNDGVLIEASNTIFLLYYFNNKEMKHYVKIIDRQTGFLNGVIELNFDSFTKMMRIDKQSNILAKFYQPNNELKYFDSKGNLLKVFSNNDLSKFVRIDLTNHDDIICFNRDDNKIIFF